MTDDLSKAKELKQIMIDNNDEFLDFTRDELKDHFEIKKLEDIRVPKIVDACTSAGLIMYPVPIQGITVTRIYLAGSTIGKFLYSILNPRVDVSCDSAFDICIKRIEGASPAEVYKKIQGLFVQEGWAKLKKVKD